MTDPTPTTPLDPRSLAFLRANLLNPGALISRRDVAEELLGLVDPALAELLKCGIERDVIPYVDAMIAVPDTQED